MRYICRLTLLTLCVLAAGAAAQTSLEEELTEGLAIEAAEVLLSELEALQHRPLRINTASARRIHALPFIHPMEARRLVSSRRLFGRFSSWTEMIERAGLNAMRWRRFTPYITLGPPSRRKTRRELSLTARRRLPDTRGLQSGSYAGDGWFLREKWILSQWPHLQARGIIEKDAGETRLADHYAGVVEYRSPAQNARVLLGDFQMEAAQGWIFWGPYGPFLGADPISPVLKNGRGLRGYAGASENHHLRGVGAEIQRGTLQLTLLASRVSIDATLDSLKRATSWPDPGYHRTATEIQKRNKATEQLLGARMQWMHRRMNLGLSSWRAGYSPEKVPGDPIRQHFQWSGTVNHVLGVDGQYIGGQWQVSGELARSRSGGIGGSLSLYLEQRGVKGVLTAYHADADFHNPRSFVMGSADLSNQRGIYAGLLLSLCNRHALSLHTELRRRPWRTYTLPISSAQRRYFSQWRSQWTRRIKSVLRLTYTVSDQRLTLHSDLGSTTVLAPSKTWRLRFESSWTYRPKETLRCRVEGSACRFPAVSTLQHAAAPMESGVLASIDWRRRSRRMQLQCRAIRFKTDSYACRIGQMAPVLPGNYGYITYSGDGWGLIGLIRCRVHRTLQLGCTAAWHRRLDDLSWGSGYDRLTGRDKCDLTLQLMWRR